MKLTMIIVVVSVLNAWFLQDTTSALSPSWVSDEPHLVHSQVIGQPVATVCHGVYELRRVSGDDTMRTVCLSLESPNGTRVGLYFINTTPKYVVALRNDPVVYPLGGCESYDNCLYMPSTDSLVTREHLINNSVRSLVIYRNFSERLVRHSSLVSGQSFSFDNSLPDFTMQSSGGYPWPVLGIGGSANGDWLGVQLRERGFVVINMNTLEVKRIVSTNIRTSTAIALTNDGKSVALMGDDYGQRVFEVGDNCGDNPGDWERALGAGDVCPSRYLYTRDYGAVGHSASHPRFDSSGDFLSFDVATEGGVMSRMQLSRTTELERIGYLALGDSFSSGEGETDDWYYIDGTNSEFNKCHTSRRSYPFALPLGPTKSVACSGATIDDIVTTNTVYWGQGGRLGAHQQSLTNSQRIEYQQSVLETFLPGVTHQEKFIERYRPLVVTIGVGGNDAGLMGKLQTCLMPDTCEWARDQSLRRGTSDEIGRLFERLTGLYARLRSLSPDTVFYAVGYPKIIDPNGSCSVAVATMLNYDERVFMDESIVYLNQVIESAALRAGIQYVDIEDALGQHRLCGLEESAINTIRFGEEVAPIRQASWLKVFGSESFHPTPLGHERIAQKIKEQVVIDQYSPCPDEGLCGQSVSRPNPGPYWQPESEVDDTLQMIGNFMYPGALALPGHSMSAVFPDGTFQPGSTVRLELHSQPVVLGDFTVGHAGGLSVMFDVPETTEPGYHTIHALGKSMSDVSMRMYQPILVLASDTDTENNDQPLGLVQPAVQGGTPVYENDKVTNQLVDSDQNGLQPSSPLVLGAHRDTPQRNIDYQSSQQGMLYIVIAAAGLVSVIIVVTIIVRICYVRVNQ